MPFLVRKLNKRNLLELLKDVSSIEDIAADLPTNEMKTINGTLSAWEISSIDDLDDAVLAIASTSSRISKMDFIIIDTKLLDDNELDYERTDAGQEIPIPDLQDTHYDIEGITLKKLYDFTNVFKMIYDENGDDEKYIVRYTHGQIKSLFKAAIKDSRIDETKMNEEIKKDIY